MSQLALLEELQKKIQLCNNWIRDSGNVSETDKQTVEGFVKSLRGIENINPDLSEEQKTKTIMNEINNLTLPVDKFMKEREIPIPYDGGRRRKSASSSHSRGRRSSKKRATQRKQKRRQRRASRRRV